ncbi:hypothetical protein AX14_011331 [Amanita brunnescens Koide BX004]|nr:hypothetical protein AX14_011331 [Amanita brunnescens Koide BX004]
MSAYGDLRAHSSGRVLATISWPTKRPDTYVTTIHLTITTARQSPGLVEYLNGVFAKVVEDGRTYPQEEDMSGEAFEKYFFAADVILGIVTSSHSEGGEATLEDIRASRSWEECVAGFYYVKPNYPGRSSHICNAGFVVPDVQRGAGFGSVLADSYLYYAPRLGYQASVFNLVYVNNVASIKLWERLGFVKAGKIPRAGRLRTMDGTGEEYVDAWVFYKEFDSVA